jgi:hypothetical protein
MSVRVVAHVAGWWLPDPSASLLPRRDDVLDFGVPGRSAKNGDDVLVVRKGPVRTQLGRGGEAASQTGTGQLIVMVEKKDESTVEQRGSAGRLTHDACPG